jgi:hypothetical protein
MEALKTSNIKTVHSILRTIDTEEGRQGRTGVDPYILTFETPVREYVTFAFQPCPGGTVTYNIYATTIYTLTLP